MIKKQFYFHTNAGFARPATLLVSLTHMFTSEIYVEYAGKSIRLQHSVDSIIEMMSLGIIPDTPFYICVRGIVEAQAIQTFEENLTIRNYINPNNGMFNESR